MIDHTQRSIDVASLDSGYDASMAERSRIASAYSRRTSQLRDSLFDAAYLLASHEREKGILEALARNGFLSLKEARLLEIGCGTGFWLREFLRWGARPENIAGIDLLPERIEEAKSLCPQGTDLTCASAERLQFPGGAFDIVLQSTVFTSIFDDDMKKTIAGEMLRVLRDGGVIVWYDFTVNNPWNPDVRGIPRTDIVRLFPRCRFEFHKLTLAPPIGRRIARFSPLLYRALSALKVLDTHCLATIRKIC